MSSLTIFPNFKLFLASALALTAAGILQQLPFLDLLVIKPHLSLAVLVAIAFLFDVFWVYLIMGFIAVWTATIHTSMVYITVMYLIAATTIFFSKSYLVWRVSMNVIIMASCATLGWYLATNYAYVARAPQWIALEMLENSIIALISFRVLRLFKSV